MIKGELVESNVTHQNSLPHRWPDWTLALIFAVAMCFSLMAAEWMTPRRVLADTLPPLNLVTSVPENFGPWRIDPTITPVLTDPTVSAQLQTLYSDTLSRTYRRADGARVMLSISYGKNQNSESTAAHRPEFCYSAQGFNVKRIGIDFLPVLHGSLKVVRLTAIAGARKEPITYWVTLGESASIPGLNRKMEQISYGLKGWIADGMLMRVSSIASDLTPEDQSAARKVHIDFLNDLAKAIPASNRKRFFGDIGKI